MDEESFPLKDAILSYDQLPEGPEKESLSRLIYRAIEKVTSGYDENGNRKHFGFSGMTAGEWRKEYIHSQGPDPKKQYLWLRPEDAERVAELNILQPDFLEGAYIWGDKEKAMREFKKHT
jgi:hypothetical protein